MACVDLRHVCGACGFKWPERSAYDELTLMNANLQARVRDLESTLLSEEERRKLTGDALHAEGQLAEVIRIACAASTDAESALREAGLL